ncbi:MAG: ABC transporter permease subunit, partial [Anaerolineales bacterium]|nr:ABC transporter permease subunit [Anaerolineales bacterium]
QRRRILWLGLLMAVGFLTVFGIGLHYIVSELSRTGMGREEMEVATGLLLSAGLYVVNFLIIIMSVLTSVTAISGEIDSHTIETLLTKPVRRWEVILGKWLGFVLLLLLYVMLLSGGLMLIYTLRTGFVVHNVVAGMSIMVLQGLVVLSVTMWGGTKLSTLANGVLAFMLYGIAFIGGWVEQIGALFRNETAVDIGIITSLILPTEILWKKALSLFQPKVIAAANFAGPLAVTSQPSDLMIEYAVGYTAVLLLLALYNFSRRDL